MTRILQRIRRAVLCVTLMAAAAGVLTKGTTYYETILTSETNSFDAKIATFHATANYVNLTNSLIITVQSGVFNTKGFRTGANWVIQGAGISSTTLRLTNNVGSGNPWYPHVVIVGNATNTIRSGWAVTFELKNLTLDGNWSNQSDASSSSNYKISGVDVQCDQGIINNVKLIGWGAKGASNAAVESFGLVLRTYREAEDQLPVYPGDYGPTHVTISNCEVSDFNLGYWGTATAIYMKTSFPGQGNRTETPRETQAGLVQGNVVYGNYDIIAYGTANGEQILFEGNDAWDCKLGFNADTGYNRDITLDSNSFAWCNQGIAAGNQFGLSTSDNFTITNNLFILTIPWDNPWIAETEYSYGLTLFGSTSGFEVGGNHFDADSYYTFSTGAYGIGIGYDYNDNYTDGSYLTWENLNTWYTSRPDHIKTNVTRYLP